MTSESRTTDFEARKPTLVILPLGAIEQHSKRLPLQMDTLICEAVAQELPQMIAISDPAAG